MSFTRTLISATFLAGVSATAVAAGVSIELVKREQATLPDVSVLKDYKPATASTLLADDGTAMGTFAEQDRTVVPYVDIPPIVVQAFVSAEDRNFWTHPGIDPMAVARAMVTNARNRGSGRRPLGASTITQQVVKNILVGDEASVRRKVREALMSLRVEREIGKKRIMELYLNEIYLGQGAYGVAAAAQIYFGKPLSQLDVSEAAFLAILPKGPSNYDPVKRPEAAFARRTYVVGRMLEDGAIDAATAEKANAAPLPRPAAHDFGGVADGYFAEEVRREALARYGSSSLYRGGLTIKTSMDRGLQAIADRTLRQGLVDYDRRHGWRGPVARLPVGTTLSDTTSWRTALAKVDVPQGIGDWRLAAVLSTGKDGAVVGLADGSLSSLPFSGLSWARPEQGTGVGPAPRKVEDVVRAGDVALVGAVADGRTLELEQLPEVEGALVAIETKTGRVLAMAGGFSHERSAFNRVTQSRRQPGSTFKPFVYLAGLEHGYDPTSPVLDAPVAIDLGPGLGRWEPGADGGAGLGLISFRQALEKSRNYATVRLLYDLGLDAVGDVSSAFGLYPSIPNYAAALGAVEVTDLQMTAAYAMIANGGYKVVPTFVDEVDGSNGGVMERREENRLDDATRVAPPQAVAQLTSILQGVVKRGTAARALSRIDLPLAGKTGTTNENYDAWFVGFSPDIAVGVHVGYDRPRELGGTEEGGHAAAPIFGEFMKAALAARPPSARAFAVPSGMHVERIDAATGERSKSGVDELVVDDSKPR